MEIYRLVPSFIGFYRVLLGFTEFYWVLPSFTGFHWDLPALRFPGFYRDLPVTQVLFWKDALLLGPKWETSPVPIDLGETSRKTIRIHYEAQPTLGKAMWPMLNVKIERARETVDSVASQRSGGQEWWSKKKKDIKRPSQVEEWRKNLVVEPAEVEEEN